MNLHDWIDELCDALDLDVEFDEGLVIDLARDVTERVQPSAAPVSAFLLGYAAGKARADPERTEALAARALDLANRWEGERDLDAELEVDIDEADLVDID